ncbi:M23 family metallopeptidase [Streptomyces sp. NRRL F-5053]|uniref:M23 family metallopeptidase n=1 Tax=Streptomyces sp. NRRL F-5053 TaxID=1463854 RepID=UPI0004C9E855|nr:LysM peptidoglycan-binding domain-containing protein [Streptomyces sp. NRRL F-5053]
MRKTKVATFGVLAAAMIAVPATPAFAYEVEPGDTLSELAQKHGTTWQDLAARNGLPDPDRIYAGQHLDLDGASSPDTPTAPRQQAAPPQQSAPQQPTAPRRESRPQSETQPSEQQSSGSHSAGKPSSGGSRASAPQAASRSEARAKKEIIRRESSGNPNAQNGKYHGLFQTDQPWGRGTVAEQHAGAEKYVRERYGSWKSALHFHDTHGWY